MPSKDIPLSKVPIGSLAKIKSISSHASIRQRLLDMGIIPGTKIKALRESPFKDPVAYLIRDTIIALRKEESQNIIVELIE